MDADYVVLAIEPEDIWAYAGRHDLDDLLDDDETCRLIAYNASAHMRNYLFNHYGDAVNIELAVNDSIQSAVNMYLEKESKYYGKRLQD